MATAEQIKALIKSHAEGDEARFLAVALQVAAHEARQGKSHFARELRELVDHAKLASAGARQRGKPVPMVRPRGALDGLLSASYPDTHLRDMVLHEGSRRKLERVVLEYRQRDRLRAHGLSPRRKLLLIGAPGTGKTMTASALAGELHFPLFTIQLHGLMTKFMGETAAKLRLIFDAIADTRAVYLFDEFDAVGGDRAAENDVGEVRRVLNSFLQFLEQDDSDSVIVAATNHPQILDRALWRRFDDVVTFELPSPEMAAATMRARLSTFETGSLDWRELGIECNGLNYADIVRACEHAAKLAVLDERTNIDEGELLDALRDRASTHAARS
ncbi:ATP-binding protein [Myxococcota bacterium]|nr:ATP-binding protein [Myxococcota bacterium]